MDSPRYARSRCPCLDSRYQVADATAAARVFAMAFHHRQLKILRNFVEVKPALDGHAVFIVNHTAGSAKTQRRALTKVSRNRNGLIDRFLTWPHNGVR